MAHPLDQLIDRVRGAARRMTLAYGIGLTLAVLLASALLAGGLDYFVRFQSAPLRILITLACALVTGLAVVRFLLPALRRGPTDVALAQRLQDRFPDLGDKLASAVEFLRQPVDSPTAGSDMLRRAVIVEATVSAKNLNVREVLDPRPMWKALIAAGIALFVAAFVVLAWGDLAGIAMRRLANPLGSAQWPRTNELKFRDPKDPLKPPPDRVAAGQLFEAELIDVRGGMPEDVQIQYRFGDDAAAKTISEPLRRLGPVTLASRENVQRNFSYRAVGGDDHTMPWRKVTVVEPARLESLSVTMRPPEYTGWPEETSSGPIAALVGTQLAFQGRASKPLSAVTMKHENGASVAGRLAEDGRTFVIQPGQQAGRQGDSPIFAQQKLGQSPENPTEPLLVKDSGTYWLELTDKEGVVSGADQRYSMRAVPDEPPTVSLEKPLGDQEVTAEATVAFSVLAKDGHALKSVDLHIMRSDKSGDPPQVISLYAGPGKVAPTDKKGLAVAGAAGDRRVLPYDLNLADLKLPEQARLAIYATASDYRPATSQSPAVNLSIITPRQLEERLARQQAQVIGELAKALKTQRESRARVTELQIQMDQVGKLEKGDIDQLQAADLQQRDVRRMLTRGPDSVRKQIAAVLERAAANKLNNPEIERRMGALGGVLDALEGQPLPDAERELGAALKKAQIDREKSAPPAPREANQQAKRENSEALAAAGRQQDQVIDALDKAISDLKRWDQHRQFGTELSGIEKRQQEARKQTGDLLAKTLGRNMKDLTPQEVADLKKQAERQAELARDFNKLVEGMQKTRGELERSDPLAAQSLEDAAAQGRESGIAQKMAAAGSQIDQNQVASALKQQAEASQGLQEMLDVLSNRREQELSRLVAKLREAEQKLSDVRKQQSALKKKMQEAGKKADPEERRRELQRLAREQEQLQKEAQRLARQLQRLEARRAADKLARAGQRMGKSGQQGAAGEQQQAEAEAAAAEKDLEEAEQQLAQERRQAEIDLVQEQLVRLKDKLVGLKQQQEAFIDETKRLDGLRGRQQRLTRGQEASVSNLARNQAGLGLDVDQMARKLAAAEGFGLALQRAAADMARAAGSLARLNTGKEPQQAQQRALGRLKLIMEALQQDKSESDMEEPGGMGQPQPGAKPKQQPAGDGIHTLQELKLLKLMQQEVRERTDAIETRKREGASLEEAEVRELGELSEEQSRLADLMLKLREPAAPAPEDNPDKLPGDTAAEDPGLEAPPADPDKDGQRETKNE